MSMPVLVAAPGRPAPFLHRLNPLAKVAGLLPAMVLMVFVRDIAIPLAFVVLAVVLLLVGARMGRRRLLGFFVVLPAATVVASLAFGLWADAAPSGSEAVLLRLGDFRFTQGALLVGFATALRLAGLVVLAMIGGLTTTGPDLVRSMIQQLRMPYRVGYTALAAYRFIPRFGRELELIRQAHRVRAMRGGRGPVAAFRRNVGYVVPLLAGAIRHAERVALAMDSRAFGAHPTRTERYMIPFRLRDWVFVLLFWAASAVVVSLPALMSVR